MREGFERGGSLVCNRSGPRTVAANGYELIGSRGVQSHVRDFAPAKVWLSLPLGDRLPPDTPVVGTAIAHAVRYIAVLAHREEGIVRAPCYHPGGS